MTQPPPTICGWTLSDGRVCIDTREGPDAYCPAHEARATCQGCGARAGHECTQFLFTSRCSLPLCSSCEHKDGAAHGPVVSAAKAAHDTMVTTAELSITDAVNQGLLILPPGATARPDAELLVTHLTTHTMMQVLSGMANPPT